MKAAVFASGTGTNFRELLARQKAGDLDVEIAGLITDKPEAGARSIAKENNLPEFTFCVKDFENKAAYEKAVLDVCQKLGADLIILSGYMRIVGPTLLEAYPGRIINIHPAMLPSFPGAHAILDAYEAKVPETGVTVHYIDEKIDNGPVILQESVAIDPSWSLEQLETAVHAKEYDLFYRAVNKAAEDLKKKEQE